MARKRIAALKKNKIIDSQTPTIMPFFASLQTAEYADLPFLNVRTSLLTPFVKLRQSPTKVRFQFLVPNLPSKLQRSWKCICSTLTLKNASGIARVDSHDAFYLETWKHVPQSTDKYVLIVE